MKIKGSTKLLLGFAALVGGGYGAWYGYGELQLRGFEMRPLAVTRANLIAINSDSGYRVIVANRMAQLIEITEDSGAQAGVSDEQINSGVVTEVKRLPVKDLLGALQGDAESLSRLVVTVNELDKEEIPPDPIVWKQEDLEKAFNGDEALRKKLEQDLNVALDGTPLSQITPEALEIGIVIDFPIRFQVPIQGKATEVVARIQVPYQPQFTRDVMRSIEEKPDLSDELIKLTYRDAAAAVLDGSVAKENVMVSIRARYDETRLKDYAAGPQRVLNATSVILNQEQMLQASYVQAESNEGPQKYDLRLRLNDEGMKRLWKYSRQNPGFQLLLTVDGIPIAAPRVRGEITQHDVTIRQLSDERLAQEAVNVINGKDQGDKQN